MRYSDDMIFRIARFMEAASETPEAIRAALAAGDVPDREIARGFHQALRCSWSGKTSLAACQRAEEGTLAPSSGRWLKSGIVSPTECWALNTSESPQAPPRLPCRTSWSRLAPSLRDTF